MGLSESLISGANASFIGSRRLFQQPEIMEDMGFWCASGWSNLRKTKSHATFLGTDSEALSMGSAALKS